MVDGYPMTGPYGGVVALFGPAEAARMARDETVRIRVLELDWSLNDAASR